MKKSITKKDKIIFAILITFIVLGMASLYFSTGDKHEGQIHAPSDIEGKNYEEVVKMFQDNGFTDISTEPIDDLILGLLTKDGEVEEATINGSSEYTSSDWFEPSAKVVVNYHTFPADAEETEEVESNTQTEEETTSESVDDDLFYYSKSFEEARQGNSGVYAYKRDGVNGSAFYIIIDFDEGYIYEFTSGKDYDEVDRIKIDSGDLNEGLYYTFHPEGEEPFTYNLHFKYKTATTTLVMLDNDLFDYEYTTTDLEQAKRIRDSIEDVYNY